LKKIDVAFENLEGVAHISARHEKNPNVRIPAPNLDCELKTRHDGKAHIGDQQIDIASMAVEHRERLLSTAGGENSESLILHAKPRVFSDDPIIFDEKNYFGIGWRLRFHRPFSACRLTRGPAR